MQHLLPARAVLELDAQHPLATVVDDFVPADQERKLFLLEDLALILGPELVGLGGTAGAAITTAT